MAPSKSETLTPKDIYAEIGTSYRYFLNWRHALFAGYLLILYALAKTYAWLLENKYSDFDWVVFSGGLLVSLCFWGLEYRVRELYRACARAGCELEKKFDQIGIYVELDSHQISDQKITHSGVLNWFFGLISIGMFIMLLLSVCRMLK